MILLKFNHFIAHLIYVYPAAKVMIVPVHLRRGLTAGVLFIINLQKPGRDIYKKIN